MAPHQDVIFYIVIYSEILKKNILLKNFCSKTRIFIFVQILGSRLTTPYRDSFV